MGKVIDLIQGYGKDSKFLEELFAIEASNADEERLSMPIPTLGRYRKNVEFLEGVTSGRLLA
ncbi:MAG: hypothetical protein KKG59_00700, partial [Nanoarchaeota archaeon]|nr:hypothetical protein [Nanoarchaeota archaeon]